MVTGGTERLEVIRIPEQFGIALMFHNVVHIELVMNASTQGTGISGFNEHTFTFTLPTIAIIPTPDDTVGTLLFLGAGMRGTAPLRHQYAAPLLRTELHYARLTIKRTGRKRRHGTVGVPAKPGIRISKNR